MPFRDGVPRRRWCQAPLLMAVTATQCFPSEGISHQSCEPFFEMCLRCDVPGGGALVGALQYHFMTASTWRFVTGREAHRGHHAGSPSPCCSSFLGQYTPAPHAGISGTPIRLFCLPAAQVASDSLCTPLLTAVAHLRYPCHWPSPAWLQLH